MTHAEIEELLGAYALDAVEPAEADVIEAHLHECPRCRAEVADHRETAAMLAHVGATAPAGLWDRIAGSLEEPPPGLELARVVPLRPESRRGGRWLPAIAAAAAAVIGVLGFKVVDQDQRIDELVAVVEEEGINRDIAALALDPDTIKVELVSTDGRYQAEAVLGENGQGYIVRDNLPALGPDRTYQLWGQVGQGLVSLGLLGRNPSAIGFHVEGRVMALALTEEVAGGVAQSANAPVVIGTVPGQPTGRA